MINKEILEINKFGYVYKGQQNSLNLHNKLNAKVFILDEEIYIKEYLEINKKKISNIIDNDIKGEFNEDDYLLDFKVDKKLNKTYIYAVKGGNKISQVLNNIRKLKVIPIQFQIINLIIKMKKLNTFKAVIKVYENWYFVEVVNGYLINNKIYSNFNLKDSLDNILVGKISFPFNKKSFILEEV